MLRPTTQDLSHIVDLKHLWNRLRVPHPFWPGHFCDEGTRKVCDNAATYCPVGSDAPTIVAAKHYTVQDRVSGGRTSQQLCKVGFYCQFGLQLPCSDEKAYCPAGSDAPQAVSAGHYSIAINTTSGTLYVGQQLCEPGDCERHL